jgi:hypothetical protein
MGHDTAGTFSFLPNLGGMLSNALRCLGSLMKAVKNLLNGQNFPSAICTLFADCMTGLLCSRLVSQLVNWATEDLATGAPELLILSCLYSAVCSEAKLYVDSFCNYDCEGLHFKSPSMGQALCAAIVGCLAGIISAYFPPTIRNVIVQQLSGFFEGIGCQLLLPYVVGVK